MSKKARGKSFKITSDDKTEVKRSFISFRNRLLKLSGVKSSLPTSIKEYKKQTGLKQKEAEEEYWKAWTKETKRIYNNYARRAKRKTSANDNEMNTRIRLVELKNRGKAGSIETFKGYLTTLSHILNPNYYNSKLSVREEKLIKNPTSESGFTLYGAQNATLKTFNGSIVKLAYNNFIYSLSRLNYSIALEVFLKMDLPTFNSLIKKGLQQVDLVYNYRYSEGTEEALLKVLHDNGIKITYSVDGKTVEYEPDETGLE